MIKKLLLLFIFYYCSYCSAQNFQWVKEFSGYDTQWGRSIVIDNNKNIYSTGRFYDTTDFNSDSTVVNSLISNGYSDIYVSKLDENGNYIWAVSAGGPSYDISTGILLDTNNDLIIAGTFNDTSDFDPSSNIYNLNANGYDDIFILKLDSSGNFQWAKGFGSPNYEKCNSITIDNMNNIYMAGSFSGTVDFDPGPNTYNLTAAGNTDCFLIKFNSNGELVWAYRFGNVGLDEAISVKYMNGNIFITGIFCNVVDFDPSAGVFSVSAIGPIRDIFICKWDTSANFVWGKAFNGSWDEYTQFMTVDTNENVYITGCFSDTLDFDTGPGTYNLIPLYSQTFICKLNFNGDLIWVRTIEVSAGSLCRGFPIFAKNDQSVYVSGNFYAATDFDPGPGTFILTVGQGMNDIFFLKLNPQGDFVWANSFTATNYTYIGNIVLDDDENLYSTGGYAGTIDFDPGLNNYSLTSISNYDAFVHKQGPIASFANELEAIESIEVFPNPVINNLNIKSGRLLYSIRIFDIEGRLVYEKNIKLFSFNFDLNLEPGIYCLEIVTEGMNIQRKKIVKY